MLRNRNVRRSVREYTKGIFEAASSHGMSQDYNVYGESDLRAGTTPTFPYVYLIDSAIAPTQATLPFIVLEMRSVRTPYELGNRNGRFYQGFLHVFGRNRGERDDLASMLQDALGTSIPIYNYSSGSAVADGTYFEFGPDIEQFDAPPMSEELRAESSLLNMTVLSFNGLVQSEA